jgi:hypothetical protein
MPAAKPLRFRIRQIKDTPALALVAELDRHDRSGSVRNLCTGLIAN